MGNDELKDGRLPVSDRRLDQSSVDKESAEERYSAEEEIMHDKLDLDFIRMLNAVNDRGRFQFHAVIKAVDKDKREIEGYANTKNTDRVGERVEPKAFRKSLSPFKKRGKILRHHDWREPIGKPIDAKIDDVGFWIKARIESGIGYVDEAWEQIVRGLIDSFSIGYRVLKAKRPDEDPKSHDDPWRIIEALDLYEVSAVVIPANVQSTFNIAKGMLHGSDLYSPETGVWYGTGADGKMFIADQELAVDIKNDDERYAATAEAIKGVAGEIQNGTDQLAAIEELHRLNTEIKR